MTPATTEPTMQSMLETKESLRLKNLFLELACMFTVDHDKLTVENAQNGNQVTLSPRASNDDMPKIVGAKGVTFTAMRYVLLAAAKKNGLEFYLSKVKPARGTVTSAHRDPFKPLELWPKESILKLFQKTCGEMFRGEWVAGYRHEKETSTLVLRLSANDKLFMPDSQIEDSLSIVFCAIGMSNGRVIRVEIEREAQ